MKKLLILLFIFSPAVVLAAPKDLWYKFHSLPGSGQWDIGEYASMPSGGYLDIGVSHDGQVYGYRNHGGDWYDYENYTLDLETWYKFTTDNPSTGLWTVAVDGVGVVSFSAPEGADDDVSAGLVCLTSENWECSATDPAEGGGGISTTTATSTPLTIHDIAFMWLWVVFFLSFLFWPILFRGWWRYESKRRSHEY